MNKKLKRLNDLEDVDILKKYIKELNEVVIVENEVVNIFPLFDRLLSFFYNKKVEIKRQKIKKQKIKRKYVNYQKLFLLINIKKAEVIIRELENMEINGKRSFKNLNGDNLLKKAVAKYYHSKRFFLES